MGGRPRCPECGGELAGPRGHCPRCLLRQGLDGTASSLDVADASFARDDRGSSGILAELTATIGDVPRVLLRDVEADDEPPARPGGEGMPAAADRGGPLQLLGEIARGGIGAILKGRDVELGRDLAVKVLLERHRDRPEMLRRFVEEAQIGGQLQHPGIVPIYQLGTFADRRPFFTMKLVKGRTLAEILKDRPEPSSDRPRLLSIFEAVCQTVAYAHARGVIHRDLKPSNVMVGSFGEVQVMDWGLAKILPRGGAFDDEVTPTPEPEGEMGPLRTARSGSEADASQAGSVLGTPGYMAPEQARGELERVDERADVFGLGSILCELLTGGPAFAKRSSSEALRVAGSGDLSGAFARLEGCGADGELIALAKECLAADREGRPRRADAVAARVTAYLAGVQERLRRAELERVQPDARALEERKRRRLAVALAAAVAALAGVVGGGYAWLERQHATRNLAAAQGVNEALVRAAAAESRAIGPPGDVSAWGEALVQVERAEDLIRRDDPGPGLRERVRMARAGLERDRDAAREKAERLARDRALLDRLEAIRGDLAEHLDPKRSDREYAAAFRDAGLDLDSIEPERAGAWIAARSEPLELASFLDDWAHVRRKAGADKRAASRPVAAARAADKDRWRDALAPRPRLGTRRRSRRFAGWPRTSRRWGSSRSRACGCSPCN